MQGNACDTNYLQEAFIVKVKGKTRSKKPIEQTTLIDRQVENAIPDGDLWQLGIKEVTGRNLEASTRQEVNDMLNDGWMLLHIYTLKYREDDTWRERPMAILGRTHY